MPTRKTNTVVTWELYIVRYLRETRLKFTFKTAKWRSKSYHYKIYELATLVGNMHHGTPLRCSIQTVVSLMNRGAVSGGSRTAFLCCPSKSVDASSRRSNYYPTECYLLKRFTPCQEACLIFLVGSQRTFYHLYISTVAFLGSCHKRQKPQAPIRNRQTRKVTNAEIRIG